MYLKQKAEYIQNLGHTRKLNCWGATLLLLKEKRRLGWVSEERMEKFLKQKTMNVNKGFKIGDIAVFRDGYDVLQHTATYVGNGEWFHKRGGLDSRKERLLEIAKDYQSEGVTYWEIRRRK